MISDNAALHALGERLHQHRVSQRFSQADLASASGVAKRTVERIESGESVQLSNLIRVLRVLGLLANLWQLVPEPPLQPVSRIRQQGKIPQRVRKSASATVATPKWTWGDDT